MSHLLRVFELAEPLRQRLADGLPAYGSCAGMILLATEIVDAGAPGRQAVPLGAIDMTVRRNAFGSQLDSFETDLEIDELFKATGTEHPYHAVFIRGPIIESVSGSAKVLCALEDGRIVAAQQGHLLATSFHPELTGDTRFHEYFISLAS